MNRYSRCLGICLVGLLLLAAGCSGAGQDQGVLLNDDFSDPTSGWAADQQAESARGYQDGEYFIDLYAPYWFAWANPGKKYRDVIVEVDARLVSGSPDSHLGVFCRYVNEDNFYYFAISPDGYYAIFRRKDGDLAVLTGDGVGMTPSPAVKTGAEMNSVMVVCRGEKLTLSVNGELLAVVSDATHKRGDVGLGAGSGAEGNVRVQFDNFRITWP